MRSLNALAVSLALVATPLAATAAGAAQTTIAAAVAAPDRSERNLKLDEGRKPAQILQFLGLKPGMNVLDLFGANAYWAEITSPVVGPKGHVMVWNPAQFYSDKAATLMKRIGVPLKGWWASSIAGPHGAPAVTRSSLIGVQFSINVAHRASC